MEIHGCNSEELISLFKPMESRAALRREVDRTAETEGEGGSLVIPPVFCDILRTESWPLCGEYAKAMAA